MVKLNFSREEILRYAKKLNSEPCRNIEELTAEVDIFFTENELFSSRHDKCLSKNSVKSAIEHWLADEKGLQEAIKKELGLE